MTTPINLTTEWIAPGSTDAVTATVESSLAAQGGKVTGLDADFGNALKFRLIGSLFAGGQDNLVFHLHVDVRPGPADGQSLVRAEMRSTEGFYLFSLSIVDEQYRARFTTVTDTLRAATGEVTS